MRIEDFSHMLDCHIKDPKTRNGSLQDLNVVVMIKAVFIGNGSEAIELIMKVIIHVNSI